MTETYDEVDGGEEGEARVARREREARVLQFVGVRRVALCFAREVLDVRHAAVDERHGGHVFAADRRVRLADVQEVRPQATDRVLADVSEQLHATVSSVQR